MDEQQSGCAKCEALREEAQMKCEDRIKEAYEILQGRYEAIYLEHERGEHAEDAS